MALMPRVPSVVPRWQRRLLQRCSTSHHRVCTEHNRHQLNSACVPLGIAAGRHGMYISAHLPQMLKLTVIKTAVFRRDTLMSTCKLSCMRSTTRN